MAGFRGQRSGALTSVEVKNGLFGFVWLFWLNSLDQPPFQPQIWPPTSSKAKKRSVFAVFMAMMATTYMLLEIFSFEWIKILNGKKHLQYDRLTHHKVWGSSSNFSFLSFHTNIHSIKSTLCESLFNMKSVLCESKSTQNPHYVNHDSYSVDFVWILTHIVRISYYIRIHIVRILYYKYTHFA